MANFEQALEWLQEGRKVVGKYFVDGDYIFRGPSGQMFYWDHHEGKGSWMEFMINDFIQEDWQIYEEKLERVPPCKSCGQSEDVHPWACEKFVKGDKDE